MKVIATLIFAASAVLLNSCAVDGSVNANANADKKNSIIGSAGVNIDTSARVKSN